MKNKKYNCFIGFLPLVLLTAISFLLISTCYAKGNQRIGAGQQFDFAEHLFSIRDYAGAVTEYRRFIQFFPKDAKVPQARYNIGMAYFENKDFQKAADSFSEMISLPEAKYLTLSHLSTQAYFMLSQCHMQMNNPQEAVTVLHNLSVLTKNRDVQDEARYRIGWIYLETAGWNEAQISFDRISRENRERYRLEHLSAELSRIANIPRKNPRVAGALSVIPGAGFLYCGRYRDGITAFLFNGALIFGAYTAFDNDNPALGSVIALVEAGFYAGNIYGAVNSAHKYNRKHNRDFIRKLKENSRVNLSLSPDRDGLALSLEYSF
ncbi:MAG: tol-pal system YbgF family protein [Desulfococcaceae bacterium]